MKTLLISHKPSFPKIDGGCLASAQIILGLEQMGVDYQIATLATPKHPFQMEAFPEAIRGRVAVQFVVDTGRAMKNVKAWMSGERSMFLGRFYDASFEKQLVELCRSFQPDVVHFESLFAAVYMPALRKVCTAKMVLRSHNIEHELWQDRLKEASSVKQWLLKKHVERLKSEEIAYFKMADGIATISKNELDFIAENGIVTPALYLPTGLKIGAQESAYGNDFFHLAAMDWQPNIKGLNWFLKEVWHASDLAKNNILHIAGKSLDLEDYREFKGIKNHGMVADSQAFMCDFGIMVVPLFEGSGLRIKIIEAGALGVPIIATQKAVEGIGLVSGTHYLEANSATEFQNAMQLLMNDVSLRRNLGAAIRAFMQENFNQDQLNSQLIEFYKNI